MQRTTEIEMKTITTIEETCCNCATTFSMDEELQKLRKNDGLTFYCPNGHGQHYTQTVASKYQTATKRIAELEIELSDYKAECRRLKCELLNTHKDRSLLNRILNK